MAGDSKRKRTPYYCCTTHSPSDEEADQEVAAICRAPEYYQVRSHIHRRHHYFMYNALDDIEEITQQERPRHNSPSVQGPHVEH